MADDFQPGIYEAKCIEFKLVEGKNAPQIETAWQHTDGTITRMWWSTSENAWPYTLPKVKALGVTDLESPVVVNANHLIEAKIDTYNGHPKIKWEMGRTASAAAPDAIAVLNAKLKAALGPSISKVPLAPARPTPKAAAPVAPPPPPADDESDPQDAMFGKPLETKESAWAYAKGDMAKWTAAVKEVAGKAALKEKDFTPTQWAKVIEILNLPF